MSGLGARLVVFTDTGVCDGRGQHDVRLWTDGTDAYAVAVGGLEEADCTVSRDTTQIEVTCNAVVGYNRSTEEPVTCTGHARFDLTQEAWTTDARAIEFLNSYGERIER